MLKMFKFDFYKIIKSKMLLAFLIIALFFTLVNPILHYVVDGSNYSVFSSLHMTSMLYGISWIFIIPFAAKDFSSRYIKNIYPSFKKSDKIYYILSKIFYIFVFCLVYIILTMFIEIIFNYIFGGKCIYNPDKDMFTLKEFFLKMFCKMFNCVAMGTAYLFLCTLFKNEYIPIIIVLPYIYFLSDPLYSAINSIVGENFYFEKYTIFGVNGILSYCNEKDYIFITMCSIGYLALFTLLSWLMFRKKSY